MTKSDADVAAALARRCWRTLEPYHGMIYFVPEAAGAYESVGIVGRSGYFASRSAPMGAVGADVVRATFFNFNPELVWRAMTGVWDTTTPAAMIEARIAAVDEALVRLLGDEVRSPSMQRAIDLVWPAVEAASARPEGRPLFAGHAQHPAPEEPHLRLWHAITLLREFRGDGHIAALLDAGLDGIEALVMHAASGEVPASILQSTRAWSDDDWASAVARLAGRGLVDGDGAGTEAGTALRAHIEERTDHLAAAAWHAVGPDAAEELREIVRPWSRTISATAFG